MAKIVLTDEVLRAAIAAYCESTEKEFSEGEHGGLRAWTVLPGDIIVYQDSGKLICPDTATYERLSEIIMDMAQEPARGPNLPAKQNGKIYSRSQAGSQPGSALDAVRECQATEKTTYSTGKGRKAASAKTNIAALMQAGGSLEILSMAQSMDYIEYRVRAILGTQRVDSSMAIHRLQYLAKKAWDWVPKFAIDDPGLIIGTDDNLLPVFREGAIIKTRISDDDRSLLVPLPAPIAMFKELSREWQSAGRVCETKAYNRAADMILRQDFQSREELEEEKSEVDAIKNKDCAA